MGTDAASIWAGIAQIALVILVLGVAYRPLGDWIARTYTSGTHWRAERFVYRLIGVDGAASQTWRAYVRGVLVFSATGVVFVYALQRFQAVLPASLGLPAVPEGLAFNTAVSFVTNTNWQSYSPEVTLGYATQLAGLTVQNFVSAAVGMAVAVALVRSFTLVRSGTIGNFWVDLVRGITRVFLPLALITAIILILGGVIQNFSGFTTVYPLTGGTQTLPGGPVASQEAIKLLGTNGGGFFNANSAHPFENPTPWTNTFEIILLLLIPVAMPRAFGRMIGDDRQGYAILAVMGSLWAASLALLTWLELQAAGTAPALAGAALEGKEQRFGIWASTLFAASTTGTSTGAVNSMHDSYTALGGAVPLLNMMLGEVTPGGVGSGLYGMLVLAIIAVFVGGLLIGRTPEYLGKKIGPREITLASLYILVTPLLVLGGVALSFAIPGVRADLESTSIWNPGAHGLTETLYAFTSAAGNNGSAFAGLTANTPWLNTALGVAMLLGRFIPIVLVLGLAGSLAAHDRVPTTTGSLPTHRAQFVGLLTVVVIIITALTYFPVLTLGPLEEGLV